MDFNVTMHAIFDATKGYNEATTEEELVYYAYQLQDAVTRTTLMDPLDA